MLVLFLNHNDRQRDYLSNAKNLLQGVQSGWKLGEGPVKWLDNDDEAEDNNPLKALKKFVLDQRREEKGPGKDSACLGLAGVFSGAKYKEALPRLQSGLVRRAFGDWVSCSDSAVRMMLGDWSLWTGHSVVRVSFVLSAQSLFAVASLFRASRLILTRSADRWYISHR